MTKAPLPTTASPPAKVGGRWWLILVLTLPRERSGPSASLPSQNTLGGAVSRSSHPEGWRGSEKRYELNGKTNIWSGWGGTIDSFLMISMSPALPASLGHWKSKSLLDQGWPGFDSNICTSQEVHVWSPGLMLVHLSGSRDTLAWGLLGKPGGSRTAGDAEGNDTGSLQGSTTWICCQLLPQLSPSQPYGYITVLTSNFLFNPSHLFSLGFLALLLSVPKDFCPGQRQPWAPHN